VHNAPVQLLHYNLAQSQSHYGLLGFTSIFMPNQSPGDMCPLPERLAVDLCHDATSGGDETSGRLVLGRLVVALRRDVTSGGNETSGRLVPVGPPSPTRTESLTTLFWPNLHHPTQTRFKLVWVRIKGEASSER
jgi:hypothetical protein